MLLHYQLRDEDGLLRSASAQVSEALRDGERGLETRLLPLVEERALGGGEGCTERPRFGRPDVGLPKASGTALEDVGDFEQPLRSRFFGALWLPPLGKLAAGAPKVTPWPGEQPSPGEASTWLPAFRASSSRVRWHGAT